ncbi:MAG: murein DD-endopeptidase MepM/ murein hydrolase activator NlpD [Bradymonadia bacterium]
MGLASATGFLNALAASSPARTIARGGAEAVSLPERTVVREIATPRPSRTLVAVNATAGPPDEEREVVLAAAPAASTGERWAIPMENPRITSRFGPRIDPITGQRGRMHRGTDFGASSGTPVYAAASGQVVLGGWCDSGTGNCVVIDHASGWRSQYFHLSDVDVRPGEQVEQGEKIGEVGSTGRSTGPHLHFQLGRGSEAVDAEGLFGQRIE